MSTPPARIRRRPLAAPNTALSAVAISALCISIGYGITYQPLAVGAVAGLFLVAAVFALGGVERLTAFSLAAIPWLVLTIDVTPRLTLTLSSALAVLLLLSLTPLRSDVGVLPWVAVWMFATILLAQVAESTSSNQVIEAAKYSLFPAMALVVASAARRSRLVAMRSILLTSGLAAMAADGAAIVLHIGKAGAYYGVGEQLGLTADSPHEIALIGVMVAVACLLTIRDPRLRILAAVLAATPALATGVRSPLVALAVSLVVLTIRARFRPSAVLGIAVISAAIAYSGVGAIILTRYQKSQNSGEFASLTTAGSGRGAVWSTALQYWQSRGPGGIAFGAGLRSVERIELQQLGVNVEAHSDLVAILVELGVFGLVAWLLIWLALVRSGINWLVLLPLASYALTNGSLEYVGAVVFGIALSAACGDQTRMPTGLGEAGDRANLPPDPGGQSHGTSPQWI